jgi:hypothetical protein
VQEERTVRDAVDANAFDLADELDDATCVLRIGARDRDVPDGLGRPDANEVDRADDRVGLADRAGDFGVSPAIGRWIRIVKL